MPKNSFTYKSFLVYFTSAIFSLALCNVLKDFKILSLPYLVSLLYLNYNPLFLGVSYLLGFLYNFNLLEFYSALLSLFILTIYFSFLSKKLKKTNFSLIIVTVLCLSCFILLNNDVSLAYRLLCAGVSVCLTFIFITSSNLIFKKQFNYKCTSLEIACLSIFIIAVELGLINVFGSNLVKSLNYFIILSCSTLYGDSKSILLSIILATPYALFYESLYPFAVYSIISTLIFAFIKTSKFISCLLVISFDLSIMFLTDVYGAFYFEDLIYLLAPIVLFLFMPNLIYDNLKKKINALDVKHLSKYSINRVRESISNRLYEVSNVFLEMEKSFTKLKTIVSTDEDLLNKMADEIYVSVCEHCPQRNKCRELLKPDRKEILKILSVGVAKNRVSLVDLTKSFTENCGYVNGIIYEMNVLIGKYREKVKESEDLLSGKELIRMQSEGVAGVLKGMAFDFSKTLDYSLNQERILADALKKKGII